MRPRCVSWRASTGCAEHRENTGTAEAPSAQADHDPANPEMGVLRRFETVTTVHMPAHLSDVLEVHASIIHDSLPDAKAAAKTVRETQPDVIMTDWALHRYAMERASQAVIDAKTLESPGLSREPSWSSRAASAMQPSEPSP